jgi:dihydroxy-acid dehydratase
MAMGGSTNALIHLIAMAGRAGVKLKLEHFDEVSLRTPVLVNLKPIGTYLMEDYHFAGGLRGLMSEIKDLLHLDCKVIGDVGDVFCHSDSEGGESAKCAAAAAAAGGSASSAYASCTVGAVLEGCEVLNSDVIKPRATPMQPNGGTVVLKGNLCPTGGVIKGAAASAELMQHTGPAVVFKNYDDLAARIDTEELNVTKDSVLVLQNAGPVRKHTN